jgi:LPPG:FO 2-phospho-L-lactate transferase
MLAEVGVPVIAVSPIVAGRAIKGPTAKMMAELGLEPSAVGIARHYAGFLNGLIIDQADGPLAGEVRGLGIAVEITDTVMTSLEGKIRLAATAMEFAQSLGAELRDRRESGDERQSA